MEKRYCTLVPVDLVDAAEAHADAIISGDMDTAEKFIDARAAEAHRDALTRISAIHPVRFEVIAQARLGFHYIVKVRFHGAGGDAVTLQNRWRQEDGHHWRIVEVEDLGVRSPWKKPEKPTMGNGNG